MKVIRLIKLQLFPICDLIRGVARGSCVNPLRLFAAARRRTSSKSVLLTEAQKQLMVHKLPQVLRLHLKRFRYDDVTLLVHI